MKGKQFDGLALVEVSVNEDAAKNPELLPLLLRNIVVELAGYVPQGDLATFRKFMRIVSELDREFGMTE
jgi:hypothetical protein